VAGIVWGALGGVGRWASIRQIIIRDGLWAYSAYHIGGRDVGPGGMKASF
jgi:hypothetical protein